MFRERRIERKILLNFQLYCERLKVTSSKLRRVINDSFRRWNQSLPKIFGNLLQGFSEPSRLATETKGEPHLHLRGASSIKFKSTATNFNATRNPQYFTLQSPGTAVKPASRESGVCRQRETNERLTSNVVSMETRTTRRLCNECYDHDYGKLNIRGDEPSTKLIFRIIVMVRVEIQWRIDVYRNCKTLRLNIDCGTNRQ